MLQKHFEALQSTPFEQLQREYKHSMYSARQVGTTSPYFMTMDRLLCLRDSVRPCDVRAFL